MGSGNEQPRIIFMCHQVKNESPLFWFSEPEPPKPVEEPAQKPTGKYVPPSMRRAMDGSSPASSMGGGYGTSRSRLKKTAPNLTSEDDFPTLGGGPGMPRDMDGYVQPSNLYHVN